MAAVGPHGSMEVNDVACPGCLEETVDVLSDVDHVAAGQRSVGCVGLGGTHRGATIGVPTDDEFRITFQCFRSCDSRRIDLVPDSFGITERVESGLSRQSGP